jgi:electron transport complex protein RnfG
VIFRVFATAVFLWGSAAGATVLITVEEALALAFPDATADRETLFLSADQRSMVRDNSGVDVKSGLATRYVARSADGEVVGFAYLDTHVVRTLPETVMVVIDAGGTVQRVEVVAFREPMEYLPRESWYGQFEDRELDSELELKRGIRPVTGATLTARATTDAVRRVLAIHEVAGGVTNREP